VSELKRHARRLATIAEMTERLTKLEAAIAAMAARLARLEAAAGSNLSSRKDQRDGKAEFDVESMIG